MRTVGRKDVLTTGEVARACRVAPRTVSKWFDSGKLRGYRIPGSRDRRIPRQQLIAFMRAHGIPLDGLDQGACRVMILARGLQEDVREALAASDHYELRVAVNGFEAGMVAHEFSPHVVVLDVTEDREEAVGVCRMVKEAEELQAVKVLAAAEGLGEALAADLQAEGFDGCVAKPLNPDELVAAVEQATNLIT